MEPFSAIVGAIALAGVVRKTILILREARQIPKDVLVLANEIVDIESILRSCDTYLANEPDFDSRSRPEYIQLLSMVDRVAETLQDVNSTLQEAYSVHPVPHSFGLHPPVYSPEPKGKKTGMTRMSKWMSKARTLTKLQRLQREIQSVKLNLTLILSVVHSHQVSSLRESQQAFSQKIISKLADHNSIVQSMHLQINLLDASPPISRAGKESGRLSLSQPALLNSRPSQIASNEDEKSIVAITTAKERHDSGISSAPEDFAMSKLPEATVSYPSPRERGSSPRGCDWGCNCTCHKTYVFSTWRMLSSIIGYLSIEIALPETMRGPCIQSSCRSQTVPAANVECMFPSWLASAVYHIQISAPSPYTYSLDIRGARIVSDNALVFRYAIEGNLDGIKRLFQDGQASAHDTAESTGTSVLGYAVDRGHVRVWQFLLEHKADPRVQSRLKDSPLDVACTKYLATPGSRSTGPANGQSIAVSALAEDFDVADELADRSFSYLHQIVLGLVEVNLETYLSQSSAEINATDHQGRTPLLWAAIRGDIATLKILLRFGADHRAGFNGSTPLHYAVQAHVPDGVQILLDHGANTNVRNAWGITPLHYVALNRDDLAYLLPLLRANVELDVYDQFGRSPLMRAVHSNRPKIVQCLLEHGAALEQSDVWGSKPLLSAVENGFSAVAQILIQHSSSYFTASNIQSVLQVAQQVGDLMVIQALQMVKTRLAETDGS